MEIKSINFSNIAKNEAVAAPTPPTPTQVSAPQPPDIKIAVYRKDAFQHLERLDMDTVHNFMAQGYSVWINVVGLDDSDAIRDVCEKIGINALWVSDILNYDEQAKIDSFSESVFIVLKSLLPDAPSTNYFASHTAIYSKDSLVASFRQRDNVMTKKLEQRLNIPNSKIRSMGSQYLLYEILDIITDEYFYALEEVGSLVEEVESRILTQCDNHVLDDVHKLMNQIPKIQRLVHPLDRVIRSIFSNLPMPKENMNLFFSDLQTHSQQIVENLENYNNSINSLLSIHMSNVANRTSIVMQYLSIVGTIFLPLTFIGGFYGMNFKYLPGLDSPIAFYAVATIMCVIIIAEIWYFKSKKLF